MSATMQDIKNAMKAFIRGKNSKIDLSEGSIINDIVISAPSQEIAKLYEENAITSQGQSLETASDSAVDKLGTNVSILRISPRSASGTVKFFCSSAPQSDIRIPSGTVVSTYSTDGSGGIQFVVTSDVFMYAQLSASYLNPSTGVYEVSANVQAIKAGANGIVGPNAITQLVTYIPGINGCYNESSTTGGADVEETESLKSRIASKWRGNSIGVADGYLSEALSYPGVEDAIVFGGSDTGREDLGPVDIFIRGKLIETVQDTFTSYGIIPDLLLSRQPVDSNSDISVNMSAGGAIDPLLYSLQKDTGAYAGSVRGQDKIHWDVLFPAASGSVLVTYGYNKLVYDLQNYFESSARDVQNVDLLIKEAEEKAIWIVCNIKILPGYDSNSVLSSISSRITQFLNGLSIGAEIQQSEIAETILLTPGVSDLQLPLTTFQSEDGSIVKDNFYNLQLPTKAYATLGTLTINVV